MHSFRKKEILTHPLVMGTVILTLTGFLSRFIGFFYRIFLSRVFGAEGMGIDQLIAPVLALSFALTVSGIADRHFQICCQGRKDRELLCLSPGTSLPAFWLPCCFRSCVPFSSTAIQRKLRLVSEGGTDSTPFAHHFTFNPHGYCPFLHQWLLLWN